MCLIFVELHRNLIMHCIFFLFDLGDIQKKELRVEREWKMRASYIILKYMYHVWVFQSIRV